MRRVLPFLFMALFASSLFAQSSEDKSAKYGTRPLADNPEPYLYINPDYSQSFRSTDVLVNMGGGSWISETSWSIVAPVDADGVHGGQGALLSTSRDAFPRALAQLKGKCTGNL